MSVRRRRGADIDIEAVRRRRELPRLASLCLREVLLVLQRFNAIVADCSVRSRMWLLLESDEMEAELRELNHDLATLLDLLPVVELGALASPTTCSTSSPSCRASADGARRHRRRSRR
ncbi:hypothetical protein OsI_32855 [Oryza sativa Indica Group]|uniref:Uncharacterized protein n=1 Tax=Oryza sativa subsp. indica TaxID=39946 RepID=B8BFW1_ORYSI|nr:hypothetical protein OsI_32855 [Oryza sativa Indica Group]